MHLLSAEPTKTKKTDAVTVEQKKLEKSDSCALLGPQKYKMGEGAHPSGTTCEK